MEMNRKLFTRWLACIAFLPLFVAVASAQRPGTARNSISLHVEGLTSEMRDGLSRELAGTTDLELVFACVPAGILVFEGTAGTQAALLDRTLSLMEHRIARQRIRMLDANRS